MTGVEGWVWGAVIEYPCVWKDKSEAHWKFKEPCEGIFMQLEAPGGRAVYFTELTSQQTVGDTTELDVEGFNLLPPLFKMTK